MTTEPVSSDYHVTTLSPLLRDHLLEKSQQVNQTDTQSPLQRQQCKLFPLSFKGRLAPALGTASLLLVAVTVCATRDSDVSGHVDDGAHPSLASQGEGLMLVKQVTSQLALQTQPTTLSCPLRDPPSSLDSILLSIQMPQEYMSIASMGLMLQSRPHIGN